MRHISYPHIRFRALNTLLVGIRRSRGQVTAAVVALVAVIAGVGFGIYKYRATTDNVPRSIKIEKLTTDGKTFNAAISPDGKYAVYSIDEGGQQSIWTKQIATSSSVQIVPPVEGVDYQGIRFTPDGNFVTFIKRDSGITLYTLYQMPVLGGSQNKLLQDIDSPISYSPDAKQFAFVRGNFPEKFASAGGA